VPIALIWARLAGALSAHMGPLARQPKPRKQFCVPAAGVGRKHLRGAAHQTFCVCVRRLPAQYGRKNPRALAGRLRRAQTFLRTLGIEVTFSRDGRAGKRTISVSTLTEHTVSTVSSVRHQGSRSGAKQPQPADDVRDDPDLVGLCSVGQASVTAADDADGADGNAAFFG
jgi:hypothetical protein